MNSVLQKALSADELSKESLLWKVQMLQNAAAYANARLNAVKAEVLVLARFVRYFDSHSVGLSQLQSET